MTDVSEIEESEFEKLEDLDILILDSLRKTKHPSHLSLDESVAIATKINAKTTYFTHISHHMGLHSEVEKELPENIQLGYDGLRIQF
jgi:phosphoribosyl 1,2-cyclic phosphate phosphodiesterase